MGSWSGCVGGGGTEGEARVGERGEGGRRHDVLGVFEKGGMEVG